MNRIVAVEAAIRALGPDQQTGLAIALASLIEPFALLSPGGQPPTGLSTVAEAVRAATTMAEVDHARHLLWSTRELLGDDSEPEDAAWYSYSATVVWIYAADSKCTAPADGATNTLKRVLDLLDLADQTLGDTNLVERVLDALEKALKEGSGCLASDELGPAIGSAAARLASIV